MFRDYNALRGSGRITWERYADKKTRSKRTQSMKTAPRKLEWVERVLLVKAFHVEKLKLDSEWTIDKTCKELNRSKGSVSEDLMLAHWMKIFPTIQDMTYKEATVWVRKRKRELDRVI